ncbi:MAG: LTA synthase family protein [Clostridiales bacterium]|nr:LTA synthase family protein [Clostridiales bacterium]
MIKAKDFFTRYILTPTAPSFLTKRIQNKPLRITITVLAYLAALVFPIWCYLASEYVHFSTIGSGKFMHFLQTRTSVAIGMIIMLYAFFIILNLLVKKAWAANLLLGGTVIVFAVVNHFKYILTGDFFYPWDMVQAGNLGELTGFVTAGFPLKYVLALLSILLLALVPLLGNASVPLKAYVRLPIALIIGLCVFFQVNTTDKATAYLEQYGMDQMNAALQTSNYVDNGFIGGFTLNVLFLNIDQPDGYSEEAVNAYLAPYEYKEASDDFSSPDIIVILSESFWDPKSLPGSRFYDVEGNEANPLAHFDELADRKGTISGVMSNTALGGGTVRPEFEVLTGLTTDSLPSGSVPYQYLKQNIPSYVSIYKELGYQTYGVHPYIPAFYSRQTGYPYIGIDNLHFEDDFYARHDRDNWPLSTVSGGYLSDDSFERYMEEVLNENEQNTGAPAFLMGISMEAHQPYETKYKQEDLTIIAENDSLDAETLGAFRNFTMAMKNADSALGALADYIDNREKDTVFVYFGDHLPTLGVNYAAYCESGLIQSTERLSFEERFATQTTPFMIYANFDLGDSVLLKEGKDNQIASYNLLNALSELIGSPRTPYMQFLTDLGKTSPIYNVRMQIPMTDELWPFVEGQRMITYDRIAGKRYSVD